MTYRIGIDAGSKTLKLVVLDEAGTVVYDAYMRHRANIARTLGEAIHDLNWRHGPVDALIAMTGSAAIEVARVLGIPEERLKAVVQEVVATTHAVRTLEPDADVVIELGGEDAKIIYLDERPEQRMNATCAGGTGGFIDTIAYMPVQDFGNAFSTFVAQNYGAEKRDRIRTGTHWAVFWVVLFCLVIGGLVCLLAPRLMAAFVGGDAAEVIAIGTGYLRIEAAFYLGIGILFLLYGYFRAVNRPAVSVVLTICSLGTRVLLAYTLSALPALGVNGIWIAIPIGWFLADATGILLWRREGKSAKTP